MLGPQGPLALGESARVGVPWAKVVKQRCMCRGLFEMKATGVVVTQPLCLPMWAQSPKRKDAQKVAQRMDGAIDRWFLKPSTKVWFCKAPPYNL